ncbi:MAG: type IX secretion system membrane protein PorP/SprF [Flavobacteriaceae bacterium]|nr:type IX secretion system membrane protein PorP/SprF [Flavobacteriaceae bacterium]
MKRFSQIILIGSLLLFRTVSHGQQDPQYTQYMYNMTVINPAYAGSQGTLNIGVLLRKQWVGFEGAPKTATASINAPVGNNIGLGFTVITDETGPVKEQNLYADFSYTIQTSEVGRLAFGIKGGATFQRIFFDRLSTVEKEDPLIDVNNLNEIYPNVGAGIFYYSSRYYLGLSVPNILETRHFKKGKGKDSKASERMHYFLTTGYVFDLSEDVKLKPSIMVKAAVGAPVSIDLSANVLLYEKLEFGLSYRLDDSVSAIISFFIKPNLRIGYAYDHTVSDFGEHNSGTHEIMFHYNIDNSRNGKSPRFF